MQTDLQTSVWLIDGSKVGVALTRARAWIDTSLIRVGSKRRSVDIFRKDKIVDYQLFVCLPTDLWWQAILKNIIQQVNGDQWKYIQMQTYYIWRMKRHCSFNPKANPEPKHHLILETKQTYIENPTHISY